MIFFLLTLQCYSHDTPYQEVPPQFSYLKNGLDSERTNVYKEISSFDETNSGNKDNFTEREKNNYVSSHVKVINSTFYRSFSFGPFFLVGSGGAIFVMDSQLSIQRSTFEQCWSLVGGAVSLLSSQLVVNENTNFTNCSAYYMAGAIYDSGYVKTDPYFFITLCNVRFVNCSSKELYGALHLLYIIDVVIESCTFIKNQAGTTAGAIGLYNTRALIFRSSFVENSCGNHTLIQKSEYFHPYRKSFRKSIMPKGGGAIMVRFEFAPDGYNIFFNGKDHDFATQECCFINNKCLLTLDDDPNKVNPAHGFDILFAGNVSYQSFNDAFTNTQEISLGKTGFNSSFSYDGVDIKTYYSTFGNHEELSHRISKFCPCYSNLTFENHENEFHQTVEFTPETLFLVDEDFESENNDYAFTPYQTPVPIPTTIFTPHYPTRSDYHSYISDLQVISRSIQHTPTPSESFSELAGDIETITNSELETDTTSESMTETETETESQTESELQIESESESETESHSILQTETENEQEYETDSQTFPETEIKTELDTITDTEIKIQDNNSQSPIIQPDSSSKTNTITGKTSTEYTFDIIINDDHDDDNIDVTKIVGISMGVIAFLGLLALLIYLLLRKPKEVSSENINETCLSMTETKQSIITNNPLYSITDRSDPFWEDFEEPKIQFPKMPEIL